MAGLRAKACRVGALSFLTGAQEPETLELVTGGPPGPDSTTLETEAPGGASGWRTMGVETSTRAERTAGPCAALRARASRSRFSRSSSDTVLGLGRGLHGAGAAARGMDAVQQACGPLPPSGQVLCFAAPWAGTLWVRQPGEDGRRAEARLATGPVSQGRACGAGAAAGAASGLRAVDLPAHPRPPLAPMLCPIQGGPGGKALMTCASNTLT